MLCGAGNDDDEDDEDEEDSDDDDDDVGEDSDDDEFDDTVCPAGLDKTIFDKVLRHTSCNRHG